MDPNIVLSYNFRLNMNFSKSNILIILRLFMFNIFLIITFILNQLLLYKFKTFLDKGRVFASTIY